jgi:hypothetical protein
MSTMDMPAWYKAMLENGPPAAEASAAPVAPAPVATAPAARPAVAPSAVPDWYKSAASAVDSAKQKIGQNLKIAGDYQTQPGEAQPEPPPVDASKGTMVDGLNWGPANHQAPDPDAAYSALLAQRQAAAAGQPVSQTVRDAVMRNVGEAIGGGVALVAPQTGRTIQKYANTLYPQAPGAISSAANVVGGLIPAAPAMALGPAAAGAYFATQGAGGARELAAQQRAAGQNVPLWQEGADVAVQSGLGMALSALPPAARNSPLIAKALHSALQLTAYQAASNASNMMVKPVGSVGEAAQTVSQGLGQSAAIGLAGGAAHSIIEGRSPNEPATVAQQPNAIVRPAAGGTETGPAASGLPAQYPQAGSTGAGAVGEGGPAGVAANPAVSGNAPEQSGAVGGVRPEGGGQRQGGLLGGVPAGGEAGPGVERGAGQVPVSGGTPEGGAGGGSAGNQLVQAITGQRAGALPAEGRGAGYTHVLNEPFSDNLFDPAFIAGLAKERQANAAGIREIPNQSVAEQASGDKRIGQQASQESRPGQLPAQVSGPPQEQIPPPGETRQAVGSPAQVPGGIRVTESGEAAGTEIKPPASPQGLQAPDRAFPDSNAPPAATPQESVEDGLQPAMSGRHGVATIPPTLEKFAEQDLGPALSKVASMVKQTVSGIRSLTGRHDSAPAEVTMEQFRQRGGLLARKIDQFHAAMGGAEKLFDRISPEGLDAINDAAERGLPAPQVMDAKGKPLGSARIQPIIDSIHDLYAKAEEEIRRVNPDFNGIENYMGHLYKDPAKAQEVLAQMFQRGRMAPNGFTKSRSFRFLSDAREAGLEELTKNPVTVAGLRLRQMWKYINAMDVKNEMTERGVMTPIENGRLKDGNSRLPDPIFTNLQAPDPVAKVVNSALAPGMWASNKELSAPYRAYMAGSNTLNQVQLGLSGFHAATSVLNSALSEMSLAMESGLNHGNWKQAGLRAINALTGVGPAIRDLYTGTRLQKAWVDPEHATPTERMIADAAQMQGGRAFTSRQYETQMAEKMMAALKSGNYIGAALRAPSAVLDLTARPIMNWMVPKMKMGAFYAMAQNELANHPEIETADQLHAALGRAWQSVDNRFGQIVYDNLFWNRTLRDMSHVALRSVGWNIPTVQELGGGAKDALKAPFTGGGLSHRAAYAAALPVLTAIYGAVTHYLLTGKPPAKAQDYYEPGEDGKRVWLPTYMRDIISAEHAPMHAVTSKLNPMVGMIYDQMTNRNYWGDQIYNPDDPISQQLEQRGKAVLDSLKPLTLQNIERGAGPGAYLGLSKVPDSVQNSAATNMLWDRIQSRRGARTPEEEQTSKTLSGLTRGMIANHDAGMAALQKALDSKQIDRSQYREVLQYAKEPTGIAGLVRHSGLTAQDIEDAWNVATPDEQSAIRQSIMMRYRKEPHSGLRADGTKTAARQEWEYINSRQTAGAQ